MLLHPNFSQMIRFTFITIHSFNTIDYVQLFVIFNLQIENFEL